MLLIEIHQAIHPDLADQAQLLDPEEQSTRVCDSLEASALGGGAAQPGADACTSCMWPLANDFSHCKLDPPGVGVIRGSFFELKSMQEMFSLMFKSKATYFPNEASDADFDAQK